MNYTTATQAGVTNTNGEFNYLEGENVIFTIGQLTLPEVIGSSVLTPRNIFGANSLSDRRTVNLARLLQSIDQNTDLTDGIAISEITSSAAPITSSVNFDIDESDFSDIPEIINLVAANGSSLVGPFEATRHLQDTLVENGQVNLVDSTEWESISVGTTHTYDNGALYFYREDGVRLSLQPWEEGIQETTWFVTDESVFCEVGTDGVTYCLGAVENSSLVVDTIDGTYFYSDLEFSGSFTITPGNSLPNQ